MKSLYLDKEEQELNYEEILSYIKKTIYSYLKITNNLFFILQKEFSVEDLSSSCFLFFLETDIFSKYKKDKSKLSTYLYSSIINFVKAKVVFHTRQKRLYKEYSLDDPVYFNYNNSKNIFHNKSLEISNFFNRVSATIWKTNNISFSKRKKILLILECLRKGMKDRSISSDLFLSEIVIKKLKKSLFKIIRENYENPVYSRPNTI